MRSAPNGIISAGPNYLGYALLVAAAGVLLANLSFNHKSKLSPSKVSTVAAPSHDELGQELSKLSKKINSPEFQKYALNEADLKLLSAQAALKPVSKN
jgi:hypothetical protein